MSGPPTLAVIVATRNRPDSIRACIEGLVSSPRDDVEFVVIDQSDGERTKDCVQSFHDPRVRYLYQASPGKERSQNLAVEHTRAPLLLFTDDDCVPRADWLTRVEKTFDETPDAAIVYGAVVAPSHDPSRHFVPTFEPPSVRRISRRTFPAHKSRIGANMAMRRDSFDTLGGFETSMGPGSRYRSGGDWELSFRALRRGLVVVQTPLCVVVHHGERSYEGGEVATLFMRYSYGVGAGYGLHSRSGDVVAASHALAWVTQTCWEILAALVRRRRGVGFRRLTAFLAGFGRALRDGRTGPPTEH